MFMFVETRLFTRLIAEYLSDDEYLRLQEALIENPEAGKIIPGSGGIRKLRWRKEGRGKRGGLRVIYYIRSHRGLIWMLTVYSKNAKDNIPTAVLRQIKQEIEND